MRMFSRLSWLRGALVGEAGMWMGYGHVADSFAIELLKGDRCLR